MAEKNEQDPAEAGKATGSAANGNGGTATRASKAVSVPAQVAQRQGRYMVAPRSIPGQVQPMAVDSLHSVIEAMPDVQIVKRVKPRSFSTMSLGGGGTEVIVAEMSVDKGDALRASAPPNVIVEPDNRLQHFAPVDLMKLMRTNIESTMLPQTTQTGSLQLQVLGAGGKPLANASVTAYGGGFPAQGKTDANGKVELAMFGGPVEAVQALYVKPESDHWERFLSRPSLDPDSTNTVSLDPFSSLFAGFPGTGVLGWGQKLMGLDLLAAGMTGAGVRVGIIDSGCDVSHRQLGHIKGADLTTDDNSGDGWKNDEISHGSHCAGIIGAQGFEKGGIRGFAPQADIRAYKVFPGGRFSDLIEALDLCMEDGIDVVNMSLGSDSPSELVQQKIVEATQAGVACIVAAGNSSGAVQFPGVLPQVLTVSAIGQTGMFPPDSYHAQTVMADVMGQQNTFGAKFSCFGQQVAVCGPGVAIISTVPGGGYAAWDGTSMATPHITGIAALMLAHHPALASQKKRSAERVAALFQILRSCSLPLLTDPLRGGSGLPIAPLALGAVAAPSQPAAGNAAAITAAAGQAVQQPMPGAEQGAAAFTHGTFSGMQGMNVPGIAGIPIAGAIPPAILSQLLAQNALAAAQQNALAAQLVQLRAAGLI